MPVFLERFVLTIFAAVFVTFILVNPVEFDWTQRITLGVAIVALAYFVGHTIQKTRVSGLMPTPDVDVTQPPPNAGRPPEQGPKSTASAVQAEKPPTLIDLFNKDFPNTMKATDDAIGIKWNNGEVTRIKRQLYLDFPAKTKFVGFYVPSSDPLSNVRTFEACMRLAEAVSQALDEIPRKVAISGGYREQMNTIQDLTFSGRVLLYHEAFLSIQQKATIIDAYTAKHFDVQFMGPDYLGDQIIAWHHQHDPKAPH